MEANSLLHRVLTTLIAPRCCLCGQLSHQLKMALCAHCYRQLPLWQFGCSICAMPLTTETGEQQVCGDCQQHPKPYEQIRALGWYEGTIRELLGRFKYQGDLVAGKALCQSWLQHQLQFDKPELLVPVPCHTSKLAQRGFNQATFMAHQWSKVLDIPYTTELCKRISPGEANVSQSKKERFKQMKDLYQTQVCNYSHIALVDDVVTSQATVITLTKQLLKQGAKRVDVWALARTA